MVISLLLALFVFCFVFLCCQILYRYPRGVYPDTLIIAVWSREDRMIFGLALGILAGGPLGGVLQIFCILQLAKN